MYILLFALLGLGIGALVGYLVATLRRKELESQVTALQQQYEFLQQQKAEEENRWQERLQQQQNHFEQKEALLRKDADAQVASVLQQKEFLQQQKVEEEARWKERLKQQEERFEQLSRRILDQNTTQLKASNAEQLGNMIQPLKEQLEGLRKSVADTNTGNASARSSIETLVKQLMERADGISKDASNLTRALKGDSKVQGDWGEMMLSRLLEGSGLRPGEEFSMQLTFKDKKGAAFRPDVVVNLPENRTIIIDSKVSLTAYARWVAMDADVPQAEKEAALKAHIESVRRHVAELAEKDYASIVPGSIGHVLMFMPNESAYVAAVQANPEIIREAYARGVLLISPTNLLMALQLAYNLWQKERQSRNVQNIISRAESLYKKCLTVSAGMDKIRRSIDSLDNAYTQVEGQFKSGRGSLCRQIDQLCEFGVTPSRRLELEDSEGSEVSE
ncbi:MAG: DNA recombination protein RmuC [Akkermansia sp.]|nr:DNA recombination protein RmuC [Akkermansia sp.]